MKTKKVVVLPYQNRWKEDFEKIKLEILAVVKEDIIRVEHVGSTSVEGLSAKPIIDIDLVISDYSVFSVIKEKLAKIGYSHEGDLGIKDREAFKYKKTNVQSHHLYVCPQHSEELKRHIMFRDYLKKNSLARKKYSWVKEKGAMLYPDNIDAYCQFKAPCIEELYQEAKIFSS